MCDRPDLPAPLKLRAPVALAASAGKTHLISGSKRRRLWELSDRFHCPVIGVCLSADSVRRLVGRFNPAHAALSAYECHSVCVNGASRRSGLAEQLQDALERKHQLTVAQFRRIRDSGGLAAQWQAAKDRGDIAGAFWALVTHPLLDAALEEALYRDVHMIQHQAGAAERIERHAFDALGREHAMLLREFGRVQQRMTLFADEKLAQLAELNAQLLRVRGESARHAERTRQLEAELQALAKMQDASCRIEMLELTVARQQARLAEQAESNRQLQQALALARREADSLRAAQAASAPNTVGVVAKQASADSPPARTILCVGGRQGSLTTYRAAVEQTGASFLYHDGGLEQSTQVLEAGLSAADLVICQTGCISHDAYWRVKDHCKRHQKQCLYVENPSQSAIRRELVNFVKTNFSTTGKQPA